MPEYISEIAQSSNEFDTLIPSLNEISDIEEAFRLYHYGRPGVSSPPDSLSIHGHLNELTSNLQTFENSITLLEDQYQTISSSAQNLESSFDTLADQYSSLSVSASSLQNDIDNMNIEYLQINTVASSTYTLQLSDVNKIIEMTSASANFVTIPNSSSVNFPLGSSINIIRFSESELTISPASGVTILSVNDSTSLESQYSGATLYKYLDNTWMLIGSLA